MHRLRSLLLGWSMALFFGLSSLHFSVVPIGIVGSIVISPPPPIAVVIICTVRSLTGYVVRLLFPHSFVLHVHCGAQHGMSFTVFLRSCQGLVVQLVDYGYRWLLQLLL